VSCVSAACWRRCHEQRGWYHCLQLGLHRCRAHRNRWARCPSWRHSLQSGSGNGCDSTSDRRSRTNGRNISGAVKHLGCVIPPVVIGLMLCSPKISMVRHTMGDSSQFRFPYVVVILFSVFLELFKLICLQFPITHFHIFEKMLLIPFERNSSLSGRHRRLLKILFILYSINIVILVFVRISLSSLLITWPTSAICIRQHLDTFDDVSTVAIQISVLVIVRVHAT